MHKLRKAIKAVFLLLKNPWLLNKVLDADEVQRNNYFVKYGNNNGLPTADIELITGNADDTIFPYTFLDGGSTVTDHMLLRALVKKHPDGTYFEIGTWRGESAACVAPLIKQVYSLNLSDKELRAMGLHDDYIRLHRQFSKVHPNVTHLFGNSLHFDFLPYHHNVDVVFVDGDHHYESVKSDTEQAFKLLRNEQSVIVWHDYGNTPADIRWDVLNGIMDGLPADQHRFLYRVSNTLCAIYTRQPLPSYMQPLHVEPRKVFSIHVKSHPV